MMRLRRKLSVVSPQKKTAPTIHTEGNSFFVLFYLSKKSLSTGQHASSRQMVADASFAPYRTASDNGFPRIRPMTVPEK